jgi:hypothetical protein
MPHMHEGRVERLVPGKLVYVSSVRSDRSSDTGQPAGTYAFRPDKIVIEDRSGFLRRYRGEPFSEVGLGVGKTVLIISSGHEEALILPHDSSRIGNMSELARKSYDYLMFR